MAAQPRKNSKRPIRIALGAATIGVMAGSLGTGCLATGPGFAVDDCVKVTDGLLDSDMEPASCSDAVGTFDPTERIYRVDSIIENTDGGCPPLQGFFPVEFVHEPDGVTYCLVQED